jgi:hypothetical protein
MEGLFNLRPHHQRHLFGKAVPMLQKPACLMLAILLKALRVFPFQLPIEKTFATSSIW